MQYYCAAAGDRTSSSRVASLTTTPPITMAGRLQRGEMDVHKIKDESRISEEVRAVSSVSHLHAFCKPGFSNRHPFDDYIFQMHLFLGVFEIQFIQHHFLSAGRCSDSED